MNDFDKPLREILGGAGCSFLRHGKGDHDVWITASGIRLIVPMKIKSRHTANGILKDAGLPKAF